MFFYDCLCASGCISALYVCLYVSVHIHVCVCVCVCVSVCVCVFVRVRLVRQPSPWQPGSSGDTTHKPLAFLFKHFLFVNIKERPLKTQTLLIAFCLWDPK